ncbi:biosynthetic arginine decarboxylase [Ectothiorhodospiraceae bacterium 2226]|nr:biosynthetic arginine decarboxylase [Ectothiorhodospiraceae bacterium 2226]
MTEWSIKQAREQYNIAHWGGGYFDVNPAGHVVARPKRDPDHAGVDLYRLAEDIRAAGLTLPVLVRFTDILHDRVNTQCQAFAEAMDEDGYTGGFTAVYPIKVNQQRRVVEEILGSGNGNVGLEAGSKPELMAVLGIAPSGGVIVCNGYKDREYIRLALIGRQLGHRVYIVVEKLSELQLVLDEASAMGVEPLLGVRVRLASIGAGKWQNTGGEKSKFGLSAAQVLTVVERLKQAGRLEALQLLHFHLGSQIANIRDIQRGMRECARYYAELHRLGASIGTVDVGGGLGIDYEGTRSRSYCSMNYSVQEYARNVVHALWETSVEHELPHPHIITESGRALTAHHAVLLANVIDMERALERAQLEPVTDDEPLIIQDLWHGVAALQEPDASARSAIEAYHDAVHWLSEAHTMYTHGVLGIEQRARAEELYFATCRRARELLQPAARAHREVLDELDEKLADKYFCNFSVFQSLPDVWAIDQIFPIMPVHRLDEPPTRRAVLQDITCDSDGRISSYVDGHGIEPSLAVHPLREGEPYLLGIFLVGAYQEILGDMHNLFGDTDSVHVTLTEDGGHRLVEPQRGDTVDSVLRYVHFSADVLLERYRRKIKDAAVTEAQRLDYLEELRAGLTGYTYLED